MEPSEARPPPFVSPAVPFASLLSSDEDYSSTGPHTDPCIIEDDLPFELLLEVISYLTSARDLLAASQVCWRWNYAATSPSSWESVSKRSIAFAYSRKAITSAYQGDWKGFFMEHRRLSTSLLMVIPNVNAGSLCSGGYFREQFQLDGLGWSVVLLVRALQPAGQLVSIRLLPNADNGAVSVSFTVRVLSSSASGSTCSRAQHVFIDHTPLEVQLPLNSAQLSDPTRGFLGGNRIRVAVNVETLEQKVAKQAQELLSAMDKWTARGFTAERVMEVLTLSARGEWLSESLTRSLNPTSLQ